MTLPETIRLNSELETPIVLGPKGASPGPEGLTSLLSSHAAEVRALLDTHGAIIFRGFDVSNATLLEAAAGGFSGGNSWAAYREAATPRDAVDGHVSTSTTYPKTETIFQHNENSHVMSWPLYLMFCCETAATLHGATPLTDVRRVRARLPEGLRDRLESEGILYRRAFGFRKQVGFAWRTSYSVDTREAMEAYAAKNFMLPEWGPPDTDRLVMTYKRWASCTHPITSERVWFNHGTFFNFYGLLDAARKFIVAAVGVEGVPYHTFHGDGRAFTKDEYRSLRTAYESETVAVPWERGDMLLIDNMLVAHGRQPFDGPRRVLVTMTNPVEATSLVTPDVYALPDKPPRLEDIAKT